MERRSSLRADGVSQDMLPSKDTVSVATLTVPEAARVNNHVSHHHPIARSTSGNSHITNHTFADPPALMGLPDMGETLEESRLRSRENVSGDAKSCDDEKDDALGEPPPCLHENEYPDGGLRAWLVVVGSMCAAMGAFGLLASSGAFQSYYEDNLLQNYSSSEIAWISSTQTAICLTICLVTGPLLDRYGPRPMLIAGTGCLVFGFCMLSLSTEYYQIFLCHAGPIALGMDLVLIVPMGVVGQWFFRKRGLAFGLIMAGSSVGAIVWPSIIANLPQKIGWGWTIRLMALMLGILCALATLLIKTRLPPPPRGPFFQLNEFRNYAYTCLSLCYPVHGFGFFTFFMFIGTFGKLAGLTTLAPYLLVITNGASGVGRIASGLAADRLGPFNVVIIAVFGMAALVFAWMAMRTAASLIVLCVLYGFLSGAPVSLQPSMLMAVISDPRLAGTLMGQSLVLESISALCAAPIFGLIVGTGTEEERLANFQKAIGFGGAMLALSAILLIPPRLSLSRKLFAAV